MVSAVQNHFLPFIWVLRCSVTGKWRQVETSHCVVKYHTKTGNSKLPQLIVCVPSVTTSPLRGHVKCCPVQLPLSGDLCLSGPPHLGAPGVRCAASEGPAPMAPRDQCRGHMRRRPAWEHHLPCQTFPVQPGAPVPAGTRGGQVHEAEVPLMPRPGGAVTGASISWPGCRWGWLEGFVV